MKSYGGKEAGPQEFWVSHIKAGFSSRLLSSEMIYFKPKVGAYLYKLPSRVDLCPTPPLPLCVLSGGMMRSHCEDTPSPSWPLTSTPGQDGTCTIPVFQDTWRVGESPFFFLSLLWPRLAQSSPNQLLLAQHTGRDRVSLQLPSRA